MGQSIKGTVLYYGGFELPDKNAAGNRVIANGKIFESLGYKVYFLGSTSETLKTEFICVDENKNCFCIERPSSTKLWIKRMLFPKELFSMAKRFEDLALIVLYNVPYVTAKIAKKYFWKKNIKVVYDCTEWSDYTDGSSIKRLYKQIDCLLIQKRLQNVIDGIIAVSSVMLNKYKKICPTVLVPPLVDITDSIWNQVIEKEKQFTFCFAGILDGNKENINNILSAFSKLNEDDALLKIIGIGKKDVDFKVEKNVVFLGHLTHEETVKNILGCDCFVFLRPNDLRNNAGFPTKFTEAFTCGVPIITTKVSDMPDYACDRVVCCNGCDVNEIAYEMQKVVKKNIISEISDVFDYRNYLDSMQKWMKEIGM